MTKQVTYKLSPSYGRTFKWVKRQLFQNFCLPPGKGSTLKGKNLLPMFVCVEVLRPSQPNGVMSSAVSLPNHTFTGQD